MTPFIGLNPRRYGGAASAAHVFTELPRSGPMAGQAQTLIAGLPNLTISADTAASGAYFGTQANPLKYNTITINSAKRFFANAVDRNWQIHFWANTLILNGEISVNGEDASPANAPDGANGGNGAQGGLGGVGANGVCGCGVGSPGSAGSDDWDFPPSYAYAVGETTGATCAGPAVGRGEAGSGSNTAGSDPTVSGGAGGGSAGLCSLVINTLTGSATSRISANGGAFSLDSNSDFINQSNGGRGVIWIGAMVYNGLIPSARVTGYSITLKQILSSMSLSADKAFNNSWVYT
jgi:hypothetical protein